MKRKILSLILSAILMVNVLPCSVLASGDIIGDGGGGGGTGQGTNQNGWQSGTSGQAGEGVRVSVINLETRKTVGNVIDFTNIDWNSSDTLSVTPKIAYSSTGKNKLYYLNGGEWSDVKAEKYTYWYNPTVPMPRVIHDDTGAADVEVLKEYFRGEQVLRDVSLWCDIDFDYLTSGRYAILLEPVCYFTFMGEGYAMTATEIAVYNSMLASSGITTIRSKLLSVTHKNVPLSMFLDRTKEVYTGKATYEVVSRLGLKVWTGSTTGNVDDSTIKSSLGNMLVVFPAEDTPTDDEDSPPDITGSDYTYNISSDVITSVYVTAKDEINPSAPLYVSFRITTSDGVKNIAVSNIVIPKGEQQLVWCKWKTPDTPQNAVINVSVSSNNAELSRTVVNAAIVNPYEYLPPDPEAKDVPSDGWSNPSQTQKNEYPSRGAAPRHEWSVWSCDTYYVEVIDNTRTNLDNTRKAYQHDSGCLDRHRH